MQVLGHLHSRFVLISRVIMWAGIAVLMVVGVFANTPAWAETAACEGNGGNSSIPISPNVLYLVYGGPAKTYRVSLCEQPSAAVNISATAQQAGLVSIAPANFSLSSVVSQTISVAVANGHSREVPFSVEISHTATSSDPDFNYGSLNMPRVIAHYLPPDAFDDLTIVHVGESVSVDVLANDVDRYGAGLHLEADAIESPPAQGTATVDTMDDVIEYSAPEQAGATSLIYRVNDDIGNTDTAKVKIFIVPANVRNPTHFGHNAGAGGGVTIVTGDGTEIKVTVPPLTGVAPDAVVDCIFGEVAEPSANLSTRPFRPSFFTGLAFYLQCYVDGVPVSEDQLSEPVTIDVTLTDSFLESFNFYRLKVANWNGVVWRTAGLTTLLVPPNILSVKTTLFGEFLVFSDYLTTLPFVAKNNSNNLKLLPFVAKNN